jgi:hypothetical protein
VSAASRNAAMLPLAVRLAGLSFSRCAGPGCGVPSFGAFRRVQTSMSRFAALTTTYGFL